MKRAVSPVQCIVCLVDSEECAVERVETEVDSESAIEEVVQACLDTFRLNRADAEVTLKLDSPPRMFTLDVDFRISLE